MTSSDSWVLGVLDLPAVISTLSGIAVGGAITWLVSRYYYKRSASDLRWEARAATVREFDRTLLVALYRWGKRLESDRAVELGTKTTLIGLMFDCPQVSRHLLRYDLVRQGTQAFLVKVDSGLSRPPSIHYVALTEEGSGLARYLASHRAYQEQIIREWKKQGAKENDAVLVWSADPVEQIGVLRSALGEEYTKDVRFRQANERP